LNLMARIFGFDTTREYDEEEMVFQA
jgi:hypothetical protein